jgi:hypothetical protein
MIKGLISELDVRSESRDRRYEKRGQVRKERLQNSDTKINKSQT